MPTTTSLNELQLNVIACKLLNLFSVVALLLNVLDVTCSFDNPLLLLKLIALFSNDNIPSR